MKLIKRTKALQKSTKPSGVVKKKKPLNGDTESKVKKLKKSVKADAAIPLKKSKSDDKAPVTNGTVSKKKKLAKKADKSLSDKKSKNTHQKELESLKDIDPEFYDFLKKNDQKLLDFNLYDSAESDNEDEDEDKSKKTKQQNKKKAKKEESGSEEEDEEDSADDDEDEDDAKFHKPSGKLEVASDESDFEDDEAETADVDGTQKVTLNLLRQWQMQLEKPNVPLDIVRKVVQAFSSALASISADEENKAPTAFKVVGAAAFNGVVQLCVLHLQPAILRVLGLTPRSTTPLHKTKKWVKVRGCLRYYLADLIRLVEQVSSPNILSVLLKHLHQMAGMVGSFTTLGKTILKRLIVLWATGDETVRVLAFLCILKITRNQQVSMLNHVLKAMYLSYVRNSKFVSPNTLPGINFMRRSLVEMFALDLNVSYQHVFLYIRQLAIHLRNAVILKKKDSFQAVYNWQYINSIRLWTDLLGATTNKPQLQPLVFPLVTITLGVIRLIPTAQYFPLRFHCLQSLISLSKETSTFIPVLPLILEVLRSNTFNRKHTAVSMRPIQFTCILRLNKAQLSENGFRDEVVEQVFGLTLEYLAHESTSLAFTDLVVPTVLALKAYLKECRNANYTRKLKQLLDKIHDNARFIDTERQKVTFALNELPQVQAWETKMRNKGTPLSTYYASWLKTHETKKRRQASQADKINADYDVPTIKRKAKSEGVAVRNENGEVELFPSDSENEEHMMPQEDADDDEDEAAKPAKQKKKKQKSVKAKEAPQAVDIPVEEPDDVEDVDIVKDLDLNDW